MIGKLEDVPLKLIRPLFSEYTTKAQMDMKTSILKRDGQFISPIIVEKGADDEYWLVLGYPEYKAYLEWGEIDLVPCLVKPISSSVEQQVNHLRHIFSPTTSRWMEKHYLIMRLLSEDNGIDEIAEISGINSANLKKYLIHKEMPVDIQEAGYKQEKLNLLNKICRLKMSQFVKDKLFARALFENKNVLTHDQMTVIVWLPRYTNNFELLDHHEQWRLIKTKVQNFKEFLISEWQREINLYLQQQKGVWEMSISGKPTLKLSKAIRRKSVFGVSKK